MSPYSMAVTTHLLYFLAHLSPFVSNSYVPSVVAHSRRAEGNIYLGSTNKPYAGSLIVRQQNTQHGEFTTISAAVEALKSLDGPQRIFIYPGEYHGQVHIKYKYPLELQGYSDKPNSLSGNQVALKVAVSAASHGGKNAESAAIWVQSQQFKMSNINVTNSFGEGTDTQALALLGQGSNHIYEYCVFSSYQDTVNIKTINSLFYKSRIEGSVDFIFGPGTAWFELTDIVVKAPKFIATITAQKRIEGTNSIFVFNRCRVLPMDATTPAHSAYLGRPWSAHATVMFQSCYMSDVVNPQGWIQWGPQDPRTENISFQEYANYGPGANTQGRQLGSIKSQPKTIQEVLGANYKHWASK